MHRVDILCTIVLQQSSTQISNVNVISLIHQLTKDEDCTSAGVAAVPRPNTSLTHQSDSKDSCLSKEGALAEVEDFAESLNGPLLNGKFSIIGTKIVQSKWLLIFHVISGTTRA